ncbi:hypothetical protein KGF57_004518 [Candida theae]|uniref:Extracellular mutant protein 11 C-terminal domain-containing protein n=1 Tax=Candida theae TaxID=1198502 RepID=A0AAD5BB24_9ASCO|nr:uncharacterized protein KGF57_004518 [Candida theae]KAI5950008.1 hypothetical protein KGF57_004518 [Candida theae]
MNDHHHHQLAKRRKSNPSKANQFMVKIPKSNILEFDVSESDDSAESPLREESLHDDTCTNFRSPLQVGMNPVSSKKRVEITGYTKRVREVEITMTQNHDSSFDNSCPLESPFIATVEEKHAVAVKDAIDPTSNISFITWCEELNSIQDKERKLLNQLYIERYKLYLRYDMLNKVLNKYANQLNAEKSQLSEKFEHIKKTFSDILNLAV